MTTERSTEPKESKRAPLWLRVILMILLLLMVCYGFYVNTTKIIELLSQP